MSLFNKKKKEEIFSDRDIAMEQPKTNHQMINQQFVNSNSRENSEVIENTEKDISIDELDEVALMSRDLMIYIGEAISKWAKQYNMEQMPKKIVFRKALTLMNAWDRNSIFK